MIIRPCYNAYILHPPPTLHTKPAIIDPKLYTPSFLNPNRAGKNANPDAKAAGGPAVRGSAPGDLQLTRGLWVLWACIKLSMGFQKCSTGVPDLQGFCTVFRGSGSSGLGVWGGGCQGFGVETWGVSSVVEMTFRLLQNVNPTSIPKVGFSAVLLGSWPSRSADFVSQVSHNSSTEGSDFGAIEGFQVSCATLECWTLVLV